MIRPIMPSDIQQILNLAEMMHAEGKYKHLDFSRNKFSSFLLQLMKAKSLVGFVSEKEGNIVGVILSYLTEYFFGKDVFLQGIGFYVLPEKRKGKVASRLLEEWIKAVNTIKAKEGCMPATSVSDLEARRLLCSKVGLEPTVYSTIIEQHDSQVDMHSAA